MKIALNEYEDLMRQAADKMARDTNRELLEALEEFVRVMHDPRTTASMPATVKLAEAAIRKAKGEL